MNKPLFISAIGTDSGKTVISAIFCEALNANYWKPVQCGEPRDTDAVKSLLEGDRVFYEESYFLKKPASPHDAAREEGVEIDLNKVKQDGLQVSPHTIIEGAGGLMVPLNDQDFVVDFADILDCELVLVANLYLGSINHTLLSINELKNRGIKVKGIVFNGPENKESQRIILRYSGYKELLHVLEEDHVDAAMIKKYAQQLKENLNE